MRKIILDIEDCLFPVVVTSLEQVVITGCYSLVSMLMTVPDLLQVVLTKYRLFVTSCYELVVINLLTTCNVQTISDLLEQQDDDNLFQTCQQLATSSANTSC